MTQAITLSNQPIHCVDMLALDKIQTEATANANPIHLSGTEPLKYRKPSHLLFLVL